MFSSFKDFLIFAVLLCACQREKSRRGDGDTAPKRKRENKKQNIKQNQKAREKISKTVLETKDLCKTYIVDKNSNNVLQNVNFRVEEGEFVSIMGPSGSGK